jgi:hypothetical protein
MADLRISQLPADTTAADDDVFPFTSIQNSETRKIRADNLGIALARLGLRVGSGTPSSPANGDLWVDTTTNPPVLKIYNGASFTTVSFLPGSSVATSPGATAPSNPALGQLWQDTSQTPDELKMFDGANFVRVDPLGITQTAGDARYLQIATAESDYLRLGTGGTLTADLTLNGDPSTTNMAANKNYVDTQIAAIPTVDPVPAGTVIWFAGREAPTGYLAAMGQEVNRADYDDLWQALSYPGATEEDDRIGIYGNASSNLKFVLPDLRGQFVRGVDEPYGTNNPRGKDSGRQLGSDQGDQNQSHNHAGSTANTGGIHSHSVSLYAQANSSKGDGGNNEVKTSGSTATTQHPGHGHDLTITSNGGTEARPTNIALLGCIKT